MASNEDYIILTFGTDTGNNVNFRVRKVDRNIVDSSVRNAMNQIQNANAFGGNRGNIINNQRAVLYSVTREDIDLLG